MNVDGLVQEWYANGKKRIEYRLVNSKIVGWYHVWNADGSTHSLKFYRDGKIVTFDTLAKEKCNTFLEELVIKLNHPDRLEKLANAYNMDFVDYIDYI
jgi:hypothetical protein